MIAALAEMGVGPSTLSAVVGRGGLIQPIDSGTYVINDRMLNDLKETAEHASSLNGIIAADIAHDLGIPSFVVDPVVVDELDQYAKLTGFPGIERRSVFHALNQEAVARKVAKSWACPMKTGGSSSPTWGRGHRRGAPVRPGDRRERRDVRRGPFTRSGRGPFPRCR